MIVGVFLAITVFDSEMKVPFFGVRSVSDIYFETVFLYILWQEKNYIFN